MTDGLFPKQALFKNLCALKKSTDNDMLKSIAGWNIQKFIPLYARKDKHELEKIAYEIRKKDSTKTTKVVIGKERPIILIKKKKTQNKWTEVDQTNTPRDIFDKYIDFDPSYLTEETTF